MSSGGFSPEMLLEAIKMISRSLDSAATDTLERTHALLEAHFFEVTGSGSLDNAAEQRVLGVLWAEVEVALDRRRKQGR